MPTSPKQKPIGADPGSELVNSLWGRPYMTSRSIGGEGVKDFVTTVLSTHNKMCDDGGRGGGKNVKKNA